MQLRKVITLQGNHTVHFRNGDQVVLPITWAQKIINHYNDLPRPACKNTFQQGVSYSYANLEAAINVL
jgi:hypothetical protein